MFCTKCGKELLDGSRFCSNCGEAVGNIESIKPSSVSKEHIKFDWEGMDSTPTRREEKKADFNWGIDDNTSVKKANTSGLMFQDKELVRRATQELDLGDVRRKAQELRNDYSKIKEEQPKEDNGLTGIDVAVDEMSKSEHKTVKELEEELFGSYAEEEPEREKPVFKEPVFEKLVMEKPSFDEIDEEEELEEDLEEESNFDKVPLQYSVDDIIVEEKKESHDKEEPKKESILMEERKVYTEAEREDIDEYLEKTLIYSLGDFEKRLEEARERKAEREGNKHTPKAEFSIDDNVEMIVESEKPVVKEEVIEELPNVVIEEEKEDVILEEEFLEEAPKEEIPTPIIDEVKEESLIDNTPIEVSLPDNKEEVVVEEPERLDDRFLTFNQKSAEFNALLEKEKEKLNEASKKEDTLDFSTLDEFINDNFVKKEDVVTEEVSPINEVVTEEVSPIEEVKEETLIEETIKKEFAEVLNEPIEEKKKRGLFNKNDDYTQSVAVLEEIARALDEQKKDDTLASLVDDNDQKTWEKETPKVPEKQPVTRMTITGLDLEKTYDFNDNKELGKVPAEVVNEELDGSKVDELKTTLDDFYKENPKPQKRHIFAKILIVLLIILVLFEGAIVACKYFLPDSKFIALVDYYTAKILALIGQ